MKAPNISEKAVDQKLRQESLPDIEEFETSEEDKKNKEILRTHKKKEVALQKVKDKILNFFLEQGYVKDDLNIDLIDDKKAGANLHFVLDIENDQVQKKIHIKSVSNQQSSFGTKYSEVLAYKILEEYGCGPKEMSTIIEFPDGFEEYQKISGSGANIMIITQDLSNPDTENPNKSFSFRTKKEAILESQITGSNTEIMLYESAPTETEDNIQRCFITTLINLLSLRDITNNPGNIGLQYIRDEDDPITIKPHIIDFQINGFSTPIKDITNSFWSNTISNPFTSKKFQFSDSCFSFKPDDNIRISSLERIFGDDGMKAIKIIEGAINYVGDRFKQQLQCGEENLQLGEAVDFLSMYCDSIVNRFDEFNTLCKERLKNKPTISPIPANKGVNLSQKDHEHDQKRTIYHL